MNRSVSVFEDLITPVSTREFLDEYWEKKFLCLSRNRAGLFDDLFSLRDVDKWMMSVRSGLADSILLAPPAGADTAQQRFRPRDVAIDSVYEHFAKGYSVVLNHLEDCWPPLSHLVKLLGKTFCAEVGVNVYLTPKGSQTFPVHVDDHDVFVLQVYGEKVWQLHELKLQPVNRMHLLHAEDLSTTAEWGRGRVETPLLAELRLQPGDVLYVPRGMPHCAIAKDTTSLHLTISVTTLYWVDFLKAAVEQSQIHAPELRRALTPGFVTDPAAAETMRRQFETALEAFQRHLSFDETLDVITRNRVRAQGFPLDGHLAEIERLEELGLDSEVARREGIICSVELKYNFSNIRFGTRHVRGPGHLHRAMEFIRDNERFKVSELPGLDDQSKMVFVRRLIREGLLRFAEPRVQVDADELRLVAQTA